MKQYFTIFAMYKRKQTAVLDNTDEIDGKLHNGRYKGPLDRLLAEVLGKEGYDNADSSVAWREAEGDASTNDLYPG